MVLTDTSKAMDKKGKKDFNIEKMEDKFVAGKTIKTLLMGLALLMCVVVIAYK